MTLALTLKTARPLPIRAACLDPAQLAGMSLPEVERLELLWGSQRVLLCELFEVTGDSTDGRLEIHGDLSNVHHIGQEMQNGEIIIRGNVGRHLGARMSGGKITIHGNAGDWLGAEMRGGLVHVHRDAGDLVGGAYRGSTHGMTSGTILVEGNCGREAGLRMRRGVVAVGGNSGDMPGRNMLAGTLLIFGNCGRHPGAGMRRGTIGLMGPSQSELLPTFGLACRQQPTLLRLLMHKLAKQNFSSGRQALAPEYLQFNGDLTALGKGEIFVRSNG